MEHNHRSRWMWKRRLKVLAVIFTGLIYLSAGWSPLIKSSNQNANTAQAASDPVIAAAGDIACDPDDASFNGGDGNALRCRQKYTAALLVNAGLAAVLPLGDNQYECGGYQAFLQSYDLSWGQVKAITHPVVGNHEYLSSGGTNCTNGDAAGYFQYFGAAAGDPTKGYYSYDLGSWHIIALNSNCSNVGGCNATSPQVQWLQADLAAHSTLCTLAYWHIPLFSSGSLANNNSQVFWNVLYAANVDVILNGHDHIYERFAPQTPDGLPDPQRGIRQFTVGTGGSDHTSLSTLAANSQVTDVTSFGVLKLSLHASSYDWQFVPEVGGTFTDSGTATCHGASSDTTPPTAPSSLNSSLVSFDRASMNWKASTDNVGVIGYLIYRNGKKIGASPTTSYTDTTALPQTSYDYHVAAVDSGSNLSDPSNTITVTIPIPASTIFLPIVNNN